MVGKHRLKSLASQVFPGFQDRSAKRDLMMSCICLSKVSRLSTDELKKRINQTDEGVKVAL